MSITLDQARTLIDGALAEARKLNLKPVSVIVLDVRGSIVAAASEDGVSAMRARIAHGKTMSPVQQVESGAIGWPLNTARISATMCRHTPASR